VIVADIVPHDSSKMRFPEHNYVIETLRPQGSDDPFDIGVCHGLRGR